MSKKYRKKERERDSDVHSKIMEKSDRTREVIAGKLHVAYIIFFLVSG